MEMLEAARSGSIEQVRGFIDNGINVNYQDEVSLRKLLYEKVA